MEKCLVIYTTETTGDQLFISQNVTTMKKLTCSCVPVWYAFVNCISGLAPPHSPSTNPCILAITDWQLSSFYKF